MHVNLVSLRTLGLL